MRTLNKFKWLDNFLTNKIKWRVKFFMKKENIKNPIKINPKKEIKIPKK